MFIVGGEQRFQRILHFRIVTVVPHLKHSIRKMTKNVVCATQQEIIPLPSQSTFFNEFLYLCSQIAGLPMICLTFFVTTIDHNF